MLFEKMTNPDLLHAIVRPLIDLLVWLIPLLLALPGLAAIRRLRLTKRRGMEGEAQVGQALKRLFPAVAHDLMLPIGSNGLTQIDHVVLTAKGLLVIETKHYRGQITGRAGDERWVQWIGRQRHEFQNPLRQNAVHVRAVQSLGLGVPVLERVVFTDAAHFPEGLPAGVSRLATLRDDVEPWRGEKVSAGLRSAWRRLLKQARHDARTKREHRRGLRRRYGRDPRLVTALVWFGLAGAAALALWVVESPRTMESIIAVQWSGHDS